MAASPSYAASKFSGSIEAEIQIFPNEAKLEEQDDIFGSIAVRPEYYWRSENKNHKFKTKLFYRATEPNGERTHGDVREFSYLYRNSGWYLKAGVDIVFWGVTESAHLVDVINQTDNVESINGEEKLGQPMIAFGFENSIGNVDIYALPYFRTRVYPSEPERFLITFGDFLPEVDNDGNFFESEDEEESLDVAIRWYKSFDNFDIGLSYFNGINRAPLPVTLDLANSILVAQDITKIGSYYEELEQVGIEYQYLYDDWIFKLEATHKVLESGDYSEAVLGFEYTFSDMDPWGQDIGVLVEYLWNDRDAVSLFPYSWESNPEDQQTLIDAGFDFQTLEELTRESTTVEGYYLSPMQNDLFLGTRFALNDIDGTEFLAGIIYDLDDRTTSFSFEGSTRIGDSLRITGNLYFFNQVYKDNPFKPLEDDDLIELKAEWFF